MSVKIIGNSLFLDGKEFTEESLKSGSVNVKIESISTTKSSASTTLTGYNSEDNHVVFKGNNLSTDHTLNGNKITINTGDYTVLSVEGVEIENYGVTDTGSYLQPLTFTKEYLQNNYLQALSFNKEYKQKNYLQPISFNKEYEEKSYLNPLSFDKEYKEELYLQSLTFSKEYIQNNYLQSLSFDKEYQEENYLSPLNFTVEEI